MNDFIDPDLQEVVATTAIGILAWIFTVWITTKVVVWSLPKRKRA